MLHKNLNNGHTKTWLASMDSGYNLQYGWVEQQVKFVSYWVLNLLLETKTLVGYSKLFIT